MIDYSTLYVCCMITHTLDCVCTHTLTATLTTNSAVTKRTQSYLSCTRVDLKRQQRRGKQEVKWRRSVVGIKMLASQTLSCTIHTVSDKHFKAQQCISITTLYLAQQDN